MQLKFKEDIERLAIRYRNMPWENKEVYADYVAQTYYYVCYSTRLLAYSAGLLSLEDNAFFKRFIGHIAEENSHEKLAQRDLKNLGYSLEQFPERSETKMLYECQFFKIQNIDPIALMGYILLLEAVAVQECPIAAKKVSDLYGPGTASFIRVHGEEDPDHVDKAMEVIDKLPEARKAIVAQSLKQSADCFISMLDAIESRQGASQWKKSA